MEKEVETQILSFNCSSFNALHFRDYFEQVILLDKQMGYPWSNNNWLDTKVSEFYFISLLLHKDKVIAFSLYSKVADELHLLKIVVDNLERGKGLAYKLMQADLNMFKKNSKYCFLEVRVDNKSAINLYKKLGFNAIHTVNNFYSDGCSALRMSLTYSNT